MISQTLSRIDHSTLKVHQLTLVILNILAFVLNAPWLAVVISLFLLVGVMRKQPGFGFVYTHLLKPLKWVKPQVLEDNPEPHRFAQMLGGLFMAAGSLALFLQAEFLGWGLVWIVVALATFNVLGGFCVGCAVYYWLGRLNLPGFSRQAPPGTTPGRRPSRSLE